MDVTIPTPAQGSNGIRSPQQVVATPPPDNDEPLLEVTLLGMNPAEGRYLP